MDKELSYGDDYHYLPITSIKSGVGQEVTSDLFCLTIQIVNVIFIGQPNSDNWILVDAGMPKSADTIIAASEERFGPKSKPKAIILTHGHFDHVGAIVELIDHWGVPVYAHELELPYLTGKQNYPDPDPTVEGGLIAKMSPLFPNEAIHLGHHVTKLPSDYTIPSMSEWRWIHTSGHTPGHISLFRERDRLLIAGDAFVTVKQEYLYDVISQKPEISGPPRYLTTDWQAALESVRSLEALKPLIAITGHGLPFAGEILTHSLKQLADEFDRKAVPRYGKYVN
ncbi:MBL fold metallo-hydrolase [Paenibacillus sp. IHBB 10380]|uniref:MBL fold metallo-hydrolase n=1 Tax=Paenibacillus sp. IHBB 10380 TaxID=1566358 RepID=UPI0005CFA076|nr:MBL fold metallo-hydrolase [Paenibacillus sp. IHBB 10380]AJS58494.1 metallo-beta-lactamase family protein [Paenibacillus sp. IHBB 10380]